MVLDVYKRTFDSRFPVVCIDESPKQLIGETKTPILASPGQPAKYDYEYKRAVCVIFLWPANPWPENVWLKLSKEKQRGTGLISWSLCKRSRNIEIRNWKLGLHAFVLLMNVFNFGPSFSTIALYSVAFDSDKTFLLMNFRNHDLVSSSEPFFPLIKVVPGHI